jgi:TonB family protein
MIWLNNRPIQLEITPGMNNVPVMCVEERAINIKEAAKNIPPKLVPLIQKKNGLKEPVVKPKVIPKKKTPVKKVIPKKEVVKPQVVKKEIKPQPEPEKKIMPMVEKKALEVINVNLASTDIAQANNEVGALVHNALQSSWSPPIGIVPTRACVINITLKQDGTIAVLSIEQSSGIPAYDLAAKSAVAKTKFPKQLWNRSIRFSFIT